MGTSIGSLPDAAVMIVLIAIFAIVLVVAHQALKEVPLFGQKNGWIVAVCVAALSVMGLLRSFGCPSPGAPLAVEPQKGGGVLDAALLLYGAIIPSSLLVLLLLALGKWRPGKSATPRSQLRAKPTPKAGILTKQPQATAQESLQKRLEE